ncbi:MAG: NAD(P)-dependent oxidoreductase [Gammaproteobacteria bacterium]|nr:NAD(P)-dependent oxidoreductase [Gammaproteobacteria bacterium]
MKVLVTGGTGFLGKALSLKLQQSGFEVSILGRNPAICAQLEKNNFRIIKADLMDKNAIIDSCENHKYVFHCGALSSPWGNYKDFYSANVLGTRNVIAGCFKHKVTRLIHVSTPSLYFDFKDRRNISEDEPLPARAVNAYAKTKRLAENEIDSAYQNGLNVITLRPRGLFGPGDTAIIPRLIRAHQSMPLPLFREGKVLLDMTYIDNVVDALIACTDAPKEALGRKFNISNGQPMQLIELLEKLFNTLETPLKTRPVNYAMAHSAALLTEWFYQLFLPSKEPPFTRYTLGLLAKDQTLDISAAKKILGYHPKISIEEGLKRFAHSLN